MQINSKISNVVPRTGVRGGFPNVRVSSYQTGILTQATATAGAMHSMGEAIGLLLALTYGADISDASSVEAVYRGDFRPNTRIN